MRIYFLIGLIGFTYCSVSLWRNHIWPEIRGKTSLELCQFLVSFRLIDMLRQFVTIKWNPIILIPSKKHCYSSQLEEIFVVGRIFAVIKNNSTFPFQCQFLPTKTKSKSLLLLLCLRVKMGHEREAITIYGHTSANFTSFLLFPYLPIQQHVVDTKI